LPNRYVPFAVAVLAPVIVNILVFHALMAPSGLLHKRLHEYQPFVRGIQNALKFFDRCDRKTFRRAFQAANSSITVGGVGAVELVASANPGRFARSSNCSRV
jgi:hypothetical protein